MILCIDIYFYPMLRCRHKGKGQPLRVAKVEKHMKNLNFEEQLKAVELNLVSEEERSKFFVDSLKSRKFIEYRVIDRFEKLSTDLTLSNEQVEEVLKYANATALRLICDRVDKDNQNAIDIVKDRLNTFGNAKISEKLLKFVSEYDRKDYIYKMPLAYQVNHADYVFDLLEKDITMVYKFEEFATYTDTLKDYFKEFEEVEDLAEKVEDYFNNIDEVDAITEHIYQQLTRYTIADVYEYCSENDEVEIVDDLVEWWKECNYEWMECPYLDEQQIQIDMEYYCEPCIYLEGWYRSC